MKVILTGSTGFIGREVLDQCLQNPDITSIVALSRRELPPSVTNTPKLKVTILEDFLSYPDSVLQDIQGAEACIWCLGKARFPDNETTRKVSIDYTLAALKAFSQVCAPSGGGEAKKFRFVYCSGMAAERDQTKPLWFMQDFRRIRGQVENELLAYAKDHQNTFEVCILRPGMVLPKEMSIKKFILGLAPSVEVDVLARAMVYLAQYNFGIEILDNDIIGKV